MTPLRLSHSWSRRLYVGLFLLSLVYIVLYVIRLTDALTLPETLQVDIIAAIASGVVAVGAGTLFFISEKITSFWPSFAVYIIFTIATAYATQQTGGVSSPFLVIWTLLAFFAPLFGAYGWVPVFVMMGSYAAGAYLTNEFSISTAAIIIFSGLLPLGAGMFIWREAGANTEDAADKNVKNLASQLSEVASKSEIIVNAIGDGVIALDGQGVIQLINPAAQQILGWGKQDALLLNYKSILKLTDENNATIDASQDPVQQVLNTNQQARSNKLMAITQTNRKIGVALVVSPIGDPGAGVIIVFRDVTADRAEEREQAEFISTASHEMRTPVASIEGYLGLALNPNTATIDQRAHDFIMKAHEAAQHLGRLFQDLLDVSKSEDGRMTNVPKVVDLVQYTQTIAEGLTQKAAEKGLRLTFVPTQSGAQKKIMPVYYVNQDNDHIREIIDNLIENAIKYTPEGTVTVDVTGTDDKVIVSIKDSGLGIPPEDLPHLFQKFYRVNNADRQAIGGTGLGLYLARRLAESMQGRLWVESVFTQGSTFFLELPRIDSMEAERLKQMQANAPSGEQMFGGQPISYKAPLEMPLVTSIPVTVLDDAQPQAPAPAAPVASAAPVPAAPQQQVAAPAPQAVGAPAQAAPTPLPQQSDPAGAPVQPGQPGVRPATTVPRGESLTAEQKAERVRQLEAMVKEQRGPITAPQRT